MLSVQFLCDLVHLRDKRQGLPQHGHDLLGGADIHHFEESGAPREDAERHAGSLTNHPGVVLGEGLVVGLRAHDRRLAVLGAGAEAFQEELQPPQSAVQPQQSAAARLRVATSLGQVHQFILQLVLYHRLHGDVLRAVLTVQVVHQDVDLVDSILRNEAEDTPQAVQKLYKTTPPGDVMFKIDFFILRQTQLESVENLLEAEFLLF